MPSFNGDLEDHKLEVETHKLEVETHKLELEAHNLEIESKNLEVENYNDQARSYSSSVFWGLLAIGAVGVGFLVAILAGYLLGHFTHVRTKTVAQRTIVEHVATGGKAAASTASASLTAGATANLPAAGPMVNIGAGVTGASGLTATLWAQGPKNTGDVTAGPNGSVFVSTADETGKPDDGVYLVTKGSTKPVEVIKGLELTLGVVWHNNQLFVSTRGQVDVYTDFNGHGFGAKRTLLANLPYGMVGYNDQLILGPDGRFYMGIASPTDHSPLTKQLEATIVSFKPDGSDLEVYSYGVRGNTSLAFLPGTSDLFMATNQRNAPKGSTVTPPDEFGLVTRGSDWGYPSCYQQGGPACVGVAHPLVNDDPHAASDGITFIKGQWGSKYGTSAFVSEWTLGKVVRDQLTIKNGVVTATPSVMLTGVSNPGPLMTLANGSILVSAYGTGKLYAIRPGKSGAAAGTSTAAATTPAAAGSSSTAASTAAPAGAIPISASPTGNLMYSTKTLTAKAGKDTFVFTNKSSVGHNFTILKGTKVIGATPTFAKGVKDLVVTLAAGTYTFECTVPGHAAAGMKGVLTVTAAGAGSSSTAATTTPAAGSSSTAAASTAAPAGAIPIAANSSGQLMYSTKTLTAKAGKDTFVFTNKSQVPHNFTILKGSKVIGATPTFAGGVKDLVVTLAAGTYTFECTVPGHAAAGMKGVLTVTAAGAGSSSTAATTTPAAGSSSTAAASTAAPAGAIPIAANSSGQLMYSTKTLTAKAGKDTFVFTNKSQVPHNFTILKGSKVIGATPTFAGGVKDLVVTLAAGTYTFECTVPGHAAAGMKGTLTVT